jgi:glycerol-3-phosphate acyltransferase PlsX
MIRIAVDGNGGDFGLETTVLGSMMAVKKFPNLEITIFGDEEKIKELLTDSTRITVVHTKDTISMGEKDPVRAIRHQKDASLCLVMKACKNGEADACVTSGPTQCVVMGAHLIVRRLKQMERVALCPIIPNFDKKPRLLLDVGANVELRPEHFQQLAIAATIVSKEILGVVEPKVGLLNIGSEEGKGREIDRLAYDLLKNTPNINFYGNVEGNQIIDAPTDIILCDGYCGNIALKTLEGTAKTMGRMLKQEIKASLGGIIGYLFMGKNIKRFAKRMDASEVGGAMILGVGCPVVKAHGSSNAYAFFNAIRQARTMVDANIIDKVVSNLPEQGTTTNEA